MTRHSDTIPLLIQDQDNPRQWILAKPFRYFEDDEWQEIPAGFVFDFASIPRLFWWLISPTELGDVPPLKHDWKYKTGRGIRQLVDATFLRDMIIDKIPFWRRTAAYLLVRIFGGLSWNSGKVVIKEVLFA